MTLLPPPLSLSWFTGFGLFGWFTGIDPGASVLNTRLFRLLVAIELLDDASLPIAIRFSVEAIVDRSQKHASFDKIGIFLNDVLELRPGLVVLRHRCVEPTKVVTGILVPRAQPNSAG